MLYGREKLTSGRIWHRRWPGSKFFASDDHGKVQQKRMTFLLFSLFLARLYESTGRVVAVPTAWVSASALIKMLKLLV